jgi:hypothetical protein
LKVRLVGEQIEHEVRRNPDADSGSELLSTETPPQDEPREYGGTEHRRNRMRPGHVCQLDVADEGNRFIGFDDLWLLVCRTLSCYA